jgi:hypothetical protein
MRQLPLASLQRRSGTTTTVWTERRSFKLLGTGNRVPEKVRWTLALTPSSPSPGGRRPG